MIQFNILDAARQKFSATINNRRVTIRLNFNHKANRWFFDLALDGDYVLTGRKIVRNVDLIAPFDFGIGRIFSYSLQDVDPERQTLVDGRVGLYQVNEDELSAVIS